MKTISDVEFEQFELLQSIYTQEMISASMNSIVTLKEDIDQPIRKCVAMFALLGMNPYWSCCGFNYTDQPLHKQHQTGALYFVFKEVGIAQLFLTEFFESKTPWANTWKAWGEVRDEVPNIAFANYFGKDWAWPDTNHPLFSELATIRIKHLEDWLLSQSNWFRDEAVLEDTNAVYRNRFPIWQYTPKAKWVIRREDVL